MSLTDKPDIDISLGKEWTDGKHSKELGASNVTWQPVKVSVVYVDLARSRFLLMQPPVVPQTAEHHLACSLTLMVVFNAVRQIFRGTTGNLPDQQLSL